MYRNFKIGQQKARLYKALKKQRGKIVITISIHSMSQFATVDVR